MGFIHVISKKNVVRAAFVLEFVKLKNMQKIIQRSVSRKDIEEED
jgi:hypothetical protein